MEEEHPMKHDTRRKGIAVGVVSAGVIAGVVAGFFAAPMMMSDRSGMKGTDMKGMQGMGEERVPARPGREGTMGGMQGMSPAPPSAVAISAVARQLIGVRSAPAAYALLEQEIRTVGIVDYDERGLTQVNLKVSGWVQSVFVDSIGRPVRKGEPLFTLYSPDLLATQDEYLLAVKTQAQLADSPLVEAKANAVALVASARERLRLWDLTDEQIGALEGRGKAEPVLTVYAPASGIVLKREALPGKYVEPGTTLYEVADISTVWIYADIYESEVAAVKLNQPASITFAAYPGESFLGTVAYIYPTLNFEARTVRVRLELPNPGLKLKPGMYGNVALRTGSVKTLVVPKEAVLDTGLRQLVFLDRGQGFYQPSPVKLGRRSQDRVEVLEGIKEGDRVVTSANFLLDAESKLASASSMQAMMGQIGMSDWQMRGAHESKMEGMKGTEGMQGMGMEGMPGMGGMKGMKGMEGMKGMPGMKSEPAKPVSETRQVAGFSFTFSTVPEIPKTGEALFRLKVNDPAGYAVTNAHVEVSYTMPMPGMTESKAKATHIKDGIYEAKAMLGMGGTWVVATTVSIAGLPPINEKFELTVTGGGK
jgi:Cu(I)/Ag(I) efflux system membrane fusion protein